MVDLGYAFDYFAILEIKNKRGILAEKIFNNIKTNLINEIGSTNFTEITLSNEYKNLVQANEKTFEAVEKARYGNITAKEVDDCNMERYNAKIALQKRFISCNNENSIIEVKT